MIHAQLLTPPTIITEESIKAWIAETVYPIRGKEPANNDKLFDRLLKESFGDTASRVMEYIPCVIRHDSYGAPEGKQYPIEDLNIYTLQCNDKMKKLYGFLHKDNYYTTARELFNWGWTLEEILPTIDFTHYKTVRVRAPRFIYNQLQTHDNVTSVSFSARYDKSTDRKDYWMLPEYPAFILSFTNGTEVDMQRAQLAWNDFIESKSTHEIKDFMKNTLKVGRPEIWNRGADSLQYVEFTLGSFTNHPHYWEHFINQRLHDAHTQQETRETTALIAFELGIPIEEL